MEEFTKKYSFIIGCIIAVTFFLFHIITKLIHCGCAKNTVGINVNKGHEYVLEMRSPNSARHTGAQVHPASGGVPRQAKRGHDIAKSPYSASHSQSKVKNQQIYSKTPTCGSSAAGMDSNLEGSTPKPESSSTGSKKLQEKRSPHLTEDQSPQIDRPLTVRDIIMLDTGNSQYIKRHLQRNGQLIDEDSVPVSESSLTADLRASSRKTIWHLSLFDDKQNSITQVDRPGHTYLLENMNSHYLSDVSHTRSESAILQKSVPDMAFDLALQENADCLSENPSVSFSGSCNVDNMLTSDKAAMLGYTASDSLPRNEDNDKESNISELGSEWDISEENISEASSGYMRNQQEIDKRLSDQCSAHVPKFGPKGSMASISASASSFASAHDDPERYSSEAEAFVERIFSQPPDPELADDPMYSQPSDYGTKEYSSSSSEQDCDIEIDNPGTM